MSEEFLIQSPSSYKAVRFVSANIKGRIESIKEVYRKVKVLSKVRPLYVYGFKYEGCGNSYAIADDLGTVSAHYPEAIEIWKDSPYEVTLIE